MDGSESSRISALQYYNLRTKFGKVTKNIGYRSAEIIAIKREIPQRMKFPKRHRNRSSLHALRKDISVGNASSIADEDGKMDDTTNLTYQVIVLHVK